MLRRGDHCRSRARSTGDPALAVARLGAHILQFASGPTGGGLPTKQEQNIHGRRAMKRIVAIALFSTLTFGTTAFAADAVDGTWKLNVAKSKFSGTAPKSGTRVYTESADGTTLDQKMVGADGKKYDDTLVFDKQ
jgi:hypothetical protein